MLVYQRVYIHDSLFYFLCLIVSFHDNAASKKGRSVALHVQGFSISGSSINSRIDPSK
jgi:hypothetical protein